MPLKNIPLNIKVGNLFRKKFIGRNKTALISRPDYGARVYDQTRDERSHERDLWTGTTKYQSVPELQTDQTLFDRWLWNFKLLQAQTVFYNLPHFLTGHFQLDPKVSLLFSPLLQNCFCWPNSELFPRLKWRWTRAPVTRSRPKATFSVREALLDEFLCFPYFRLSIVYVKYCITICNVAKWW